jgi:hypothetical protein
MRVTFKLRGLQIRVRTNVHSRLNQFERDALRVYVYKMLDSVADHRDIRILLKNTNYASYMGSPWNLEEIGLK